MPRAAQRLAIAVALLAAGPLADGQILSGPAQVTEAAPITPSKTGLGVTDVDGDGLLDLVRCVDLAVRWHKGDGAGGFAVTGTLIPGLVGNRLELV